MLSRRRLSHDGPFFARNCARGFNIRVVLSDEERILEATGYHFCGDRWRKCMAQPSAWICIWRLSLDQALVLPLRATNSGERFLSQYLGVDLDSTWPSDALPHSYDLFSGTAGAFLLFEPSCAMNTVQYLIITHAELWLNGFSRLKQRSGV